MNSLMLPETDRDRDGFFRLNWRYSTLYSKVMYLTKQKMIINRITEYDIKSANTSSIKNRSKLKDDTIKLIEFLPSQYRKVLIGKIEKEDPSLKKTIANEIMMSKLLFFIANEIVDDDILAIKNDAVFIVGRKAKTTSFGNITFRPKNTYSMFLRLQGLELYYDRLRDTVDIKGIRDEVLEEEDHKNGMLRFLSDVMRYMVFDRRDDLRKYLMRFTDDYKSMRLPLQYYRELSRDNFYRTTMHTVSFELNLYQVSETDRDIINGIYNYKRFVLPMIQMFI